LCLCEAVDEAAAAAKASDVQMEEEQKELEIEVQADEKQCGDRVTKWQQKALVYKEELDKLKLRVEELEAQATSAAAPALRNIN